MKNKTNAELTQFLFETMQKLDSGEITTKEAGVISKEAGKENKRRDALLKDIGKQLMNPNLTADERTALKKRFDIET